MTETLRGPDVSVWQGFAIQWAQVAKAGASFAFMKITEGTQYVDPTGPRNADGVHNAGLVAGYYHFARAESNPSAGYEAQFFLDHLPPLVPSDLVVLDIETPTDGPGDYSAWALDWLQHVEQAIGFRPILYTGPWFARGLARLSDPRLGAYPLWNAAYQQPPAPAAYTPWPRVHLWQWTNQASYPSIGECDESLWLAGGLDDLKKLGKPAPAKPAPPPPAPAPAPAGRHLELVIATHLRPRPALDAMPLGPLLPIGTRVVQIPPPRGLPAQTPHWTWIRTSGDKQGYIYLPDAHAYTP